MAKCFSISSLWIFTATYLNTCYQKAGPTKISSVILFSVVNIASFLNELELFFLKETEFSSPFSSLSGVDYGMERLWRVILFDMLSTRCLFSVRLAIFPARLISIFYIPSQQATLVLTAICQAFAIINHIANGAYNHSTTSKPLPNLQAQNKLKLQKIPSTHEKELEMIVNSLHEGVCLLNSQSDVVYMNSYFQNALQISTKATLRMMSDSFSRLEFQEMSNISYSSLSAIPDPIKDDLSTRNRGSFASLEKAFLKIEEQDVQETLQNFSSLEELFNFNIKSRFSSNARSEKDADRYVATFRAKLYNQELKEWNTVALKIQILERKNSSTDPYFLILLKNIRNVDVETIRLEKENTIYRDNLLSSFSHELKTPLNSNLAFLEQSMESEIIPFEAKERLIKPALVSGRLLNYMVSDILDYSLILADVFKLDIRPKKLSKTLRSCMDLLQLKLEEKNLRMNLVMEEDTQEPFHTDHRRLSQVLINLLSNAAQFTMRGGIKVMVTKSSESRVVISVEDTGIGMSLGTKQKLMYTLEREQLQNKLNDHSVGIGIGLFMANKLSKLLNPKGRQGIWFDSSKNKGSTFCFEIKNMNQDSKQLISLTASPKKVSLGEMEPNSGLNVKVRQYSTRSMKNSFEFRQRIQRAASQGRVLVVDDESFNVLVIENFCRSVNVTVEKAFNGEEAIKKLQECARDGGPAIRLVFMDINMPVMDGYVATRKIHELALQNEFEDVTVVGVTAYNSWEKTDKALKSGMTEVLHKPVSKDTIVDVVRRYGVF